MGKVRTPEQQHPRAYDHQHRPAHGLEVVKTKIQTQTDYYYYDTEKLHVQETVIMEKVVGMVAAKHIVFHADILNGLVPCYLLQKNHHS